MKNQTIKTWNFEKQIKKKWLDLLNTRQPKLITALLEVVQEKTIGFWLIATVNVQCPPKKQYNPANRYPYGNLGNSSICRKFQSEHEKINPETQYPLPELFIKVALHVLITITHKTKNAKNTTDEWNNEAINMMWSYMTIIPWDRVGYEVIK